jgi:hypothetical protein
LDGNFKKLFVKEVKPRTPKPRLEPWHMTITKINGGILKHLILLE